MKYLGIYQDKQFNFSKQIDHVTEKTITLINMLTKSAKLQWGLGHKALHTIYCDDAPPLLQSRSLPASTPDTNTTKVTSPHPSLTSAAYVTATQQQKGTVN